MSKIGQFAPTFKLPDENGGIHTNKDYLGKKYLLYFYPKDFTPGCTKEACNFRDKFALLRKKITILGVSRDTVTSHKRFKDKYSLPFTLLSDTKGETVKKYGADGLILPKRTSFLIDEKGKIEKIYKKVNPQTHAEEILKDLNFSSN